MGCGGSRADTIEPRYYESWTRETESTWLTNTDTEAPLPIISNGCTNNASEPSALDKGSMHVYSSTSEGGTQTHTHVTMSSTVHEKVSADKKTSTIGTNTHSEKHQLTHVPATTKQKLRMLRTEEKRRDANKMPAKEVSIHVTKNICSVESDGRKMEKYMK
ncbi:brain and acute leukemia cytoplasmic protein-like [Heterodontus francisci]|uniref:brain and acute leukemia cytoplasmic protein-like n=1 Tax=Heterodontus francisci TaxID=7792 RepID=UPI00355AE2E8